MAASEWLDLLWIVCVHAIWCWIYIPENVCLYVWMPGWNNIWSPGSSCVLEWGFGPLPAMDLHIL